MRRPIYAILDAMKKLVCAIFLPFLAFAAPSQRQADMNFRAQSAFNGTVQKARRHDRTLGAAELFHAAFFFCETGKHLDQLDLLFDVAAEMQDRGPDSRTFGNFRWYWRDGLVMDLNAVDFCMQTGSLLARDHLDKMPPSVRKKFLELCDRAITGCLAHRVRDSYTNIAIMNAVNLILLGEARDRRDVFDEGVKRLDAFTLNTVLCGVCEYSSPTYTGVDIVNLHRLHAYVRDAAVRDRAERLLKLFWTDVCASAFAPAGRLGGAHSRDYDYLYGRGSVAALLRAVGVAAPLPGPPERLPPELDISDWRPDAAITALAAKAPRSLVSFWGEEDDKYRTAWIGRNVSLGIVGANYWNMDIPLAVDFASARQQVRGYFIADARRDPYGMKKIPEGNGPHQKTLHLHPFWCGVQRGHDALGLAVYRPGDVPPDTPTLESHLVFPSDADEIYVDAERIVPVRGKPFARPVPDGARLFVRVGAGAFAACVAWSRNLTGQPAPVALVWDDHAGIDACRFTVAHHDFWGRPMDVAKPPAAAFWVRVCDDVSTPAAFAAFRAAFAAARSTVQADAAQIAVQVSGEAGPLALSADTPFIAPARVVPEPQRAVFAIDGRDVGTEILGDVPGLAEYRAERERMLKAIAANRVPVSSRRAAKWDAENGAVKPDMVVGDDPTASGGKFAWTPGRIGGRGSGTGSVSWQLDVQDAGTYRLWGRVFAPTPDDDSFFVSAYVGEFASKKRSRGPTVFEKTEWHVGGSAAQWKWIQFPTDLALPAGSVVLTLHAREDGTKVDRLFLTADLSQEPVD